MKSSPTVPIIEETDVMEKVKEDAKVFLEKAKAFAEVAMIHIGNLASKNALVMVLGLLIPTLYLRVPTIMTMGYYRFVLGKSIATPPRHYKVQAPPSIGMDEVLQDVISIPAKVNNTDEEEEEEPLFGPWLTEEEYNNDETEEEEEEDPIIECQQGLVLLTGATGSVGSKSAQLLLDQGFCVRIFTESLVQAQAKLSGLIDSLSEEQIADGLRIEFVEGLLGDGGASINKAFEKRETTGYAGVTHVLFAASSSSVGNNMDAVHHRGVEECAAAAAQAGTVQSMVVMSAAWVSKPYSLASLLYNGMYDNLPSAKHWQGEDALRHIANELEQHHYCEQQPEGECSYDGEQQQPNNETSSSPVPLNYVILRSGRLIPDDSSEAGESSGNGIGLSQDDSFDFWGPAGAGPGMSHSQLAQAAVAALRVEGKYTVEVTSGSTAPGDAQKMFSMLLQDDEYGSAFSLNQTVTIEDVELVHAQAMTDFVNVIFTLFVGTILLVALLGPGPGLFLSMTLYLITIMMWKFFLSDRTIWDCLASEMPRKLPLLHVPGVSFGGLAVSH